MGYVTRTGTETYTYYVTKSRRVFTGFEDATRARAKFIFFKCEGLTPNTRHFFFFDNKNVTNYVSTDSVNAPDDYYTLPRNSPKRSPGKRFASETGFPTEFGGPTSEIYSDDEGKIEGLFYLQSNNNFYFPTGTRTFTAIDISVLDLDNAISKSQQQFIIDGGIERYKMEYYSVRRTGTRSYTYQEYVPDPPDPPVGGGETGTGGSGTIVCHGPGSGAECFIAGTQISMYDGTYKNIEDIAVGDEVIGWDADNQIQKNTVLNVHDIVPQKQKLCTINNHITSTDSHLYLSKRGWVSVNPEKSKEIYSDYNLDISEMQIGDELYTMGLDDGKGGTFDTIAVDSIETNDEDVKVYNFTVDNTSNYIANNFVVHNKSLKEPDPEPSGPSVVQVDGPFDPDDFAGGDSSPSSSSVIDDGPLGNRNDSIVDEMVVGAVAGALIAGTAAAATGAGIGAAIGAVLACCFIMLEARYGDGTMDKVVRRYRDEKMTDRNRRGYYKVAEVLVPMMRKSKFAKWLVTKTFADPLVCYGKWYYGENKYGWIFKPVEKFWMWVFETVGGEVEFIRANGEVV